MNDEITLYQFRSSHYNEKARWALDFKKAPHRKVSLLPGPHMPFMKRRTGQSATPALEVGGEWITGSTAILHWLEARFPEPRLFPEDPEAASEVDQWIAWLDETVGWHIRVLGLGAMVTSASYITQVFAADKTRLQRALYSATFPIARSMITRANGIDADGIDLANREMRIALDRLATRVPTNDYLVGDQFTAADLTACSLLAILAEPDWETVRRPEPMIPALRELLDAWRAEPVLEWVRDTFARHRAPDR